MLEYKVVIKTKSNFVCPKCNAAWITRPQEVWFKKPDICVVCSTWLTHDDTHRLKIADALDRLEIRRTMPIAFARLTKIERSL